MLKSTHSVLGINMMNRRTRSIGYSLTLLLAKVLSVLAAGALASLAWAAPVPIIPPAPDINATSYLLIDAASQEVLVEHNAHEHNAPASLTKIMTAYLAEQEIASGRISPKDDVTVSVNAWRTGGSKMFIREGTTVKVEDLLKGIIVQSGNDASIALAEHIAGSESAFADMMNQQAKVLGMTNSYFVNATGLPAEDHYSSAWDLALLTRDLIDRFTEQYALYSQRSYTFNDIEQPNRNKLLWRDRSVDGVKTGYTRAAGYCLVASAVRDGMRLISVVMGTDSDQARMSESQKLLSYGFRYFETQELYKADITLKEQELHYGELENVGLGVEDDVVLTFPRGYYQDIKAEMTVPKVVEAPLAVGQTVGELVLTLHDEVIYQAPLVALQEVPEAGVFGRMGDFIGVFIDGLFSKE